MQNLLLFIFSATIIATFAKAVQKWLGEGGLIAWVALQAILSNLLVLKQINLLGLEATASDVFTIGGLIGLNLLQQYHGYEAAKRAIGTAFFSLCFFCIVSQIHLLYQPTPYDFAQDAYALILTPTPRLLMASIVAYAISQGLDVLLFKHLYQRLGPSSGLTCHIVSVLIAQCFDTVLFGALGLYGIVNDIVQVIIVSYFIKSFALFATLPFTRFNSARKATPV